MTTLLRQIQDAATDDSVGLPTLLRKCKVLGARLGNDDFKQWVNWELEGYNGIEDEDLPSYRKLFVHSKGTFVGGFGRRLDNGPIPVECLPEAIREAMSMSYLGQAVAAIESLVSDSSSGTLQEPWNPGLTARVGRRIYEGMNCLQAWKVIPKANLVALLDAVRTKILNFALEIEMENPAAGEAESNSTPVPQEKISQIFNTYITGNVQNLAHGNSSVSQEATFTQNQQSEVMNELLLAVVKSNLPAPTKAAAAGAIEELRDAKDKKSLGEKYTAFMGVLSDHIGVLGPVVAPYLPAVAALIHQATA